ncbi:hypothetical protein [Cytobacillus praedii]|nr:hypothetical protein [Cytobacillus praedii]
MNTIGEKWWLIGAKDARLQRDKRDRGDSLEAIATRMLTAHAAVRCAS